MDDDHMRIWNNENAWDDAWERWATALESLLGHDLDGSLNEDGYSLDTAYGMWDAGLTIEDAYCIITLHKNKLQ